MSLKKAFQKMIQVLGIADTATLMEMTESALDNRVHERKGQQFTVRQALRLQDISQTTVFAEEIASMSGGTFVKLPDLGHVDNMSLLAKFNDMHAKLGLLSQKYGEYTADDELDKRERADLSAIADEIHRTMEEFLALSFRVFGKDDGAAPVPSRNHA